MSDHWTVARVLSWMTQDFTSLGISSSRLDAELLLSHVLQCDRVKLYMDMQRPLGREELDAARKLVQRRRTREPVAYILGEKEFYRRRFGVNRAVLVPRPETELLVDRALEILPPAAARALDLCTGSGVVAITLLAERPGLQVDATDISSEAISVAQQNAERHGVLGRLGLCHGDLFEPLPAHRAYSVITANPPYVASNELSGLAPEVAEHEPKLALLGGDDGLQVVRRVCEQAREHLEPGGGLLLEIGAGQARAVAEMLEAGAFEHVAVHRDLAGIERVVEARRALSS
jgi:release factor glutamine methyltransferase